MTKRRLILILVAVAVSLISMLVRVNAADYKVLNQGHVRSCVICAVETYIDVVGDPSDVGVRRAVRDLGKGMGENETVLNYYLSKGAITGFECVDEITEFPVLVITWMDIADWQDGDITVPGMVFYRFTRNGADWQRERLLHRS